jgi:hypothetical protein
VNYWGVALSLIFDEPFSYFPDNIFCTCVLNIFIKYLDLALFQAAMYIVFKKLLANNRNLRALFYVV